MEGVLQQVRLFLRRAVEVDPVPDVRVVREVCGREPVALLDLAVGAPEVREQRQSPTGFSSWAWAAARRAMGTRYGEQET
jgi:hypothetical protein